MKIKWWRRILVGLTFISVVTTTVFITWKIVQHNNLEVESRTNNRSYKPIKIDREDYYKLLNYKQGSYIFDMRNTEYYLVHKALSLYPELANKTFSFKIDDQSYPKTISFEIGTNQATKWFYSII